MRERRERLASLISGGGTTMQEIFKACKAGEISMDIGCVISSDPNAGGIDKAIKMGIDQNNIIVINPRNYKENGKIDQEKFGLQIIKELKQREITVVAQNGWMPKTPENIIKKYDGKIFNQHPGPVPEFGGQGMYGRRVHAAVLIFRRLTKGESWTEVIAQRADKEFDKGAVVRSRRIDILTSDTVDDLQQRALPVEHKVQIELLKDFADGKIKEETMRQNIVKPGEEHILFLAKKVAVLLYPHG